VFKALSELTCGKLRIVYCGDYVPETVQAKVRQALGDQAIALRGEWRWGDDDRNHMANCNVSLRYQPGLGRIIRQSGADVLIADGFFKWTLSAVWHRLLRSVPLVITYERTEHTERRAQAVRTWYRKRIVHVADAMACSGSLCRDYAAGLGMHPNRISTGHMTADIDRIAAEAQTLSTDVKRAMRLEWRTQGLVLTCVGRLAEGKGVHECLSAWKAIQGDVCRNATLIFIGSGPLKRKLQQRCHDENITGVRFTGHIPSEQIARYYAMADVLVMPTLEDNWSLVVPEAMATGLPILCSIYNGCWPELVHEDVNGWVFDPTDKAGFAHALTRCINAADRYPGMGKKSKCLVQNYSPRRAAESILQASQMAIEHRNVSKNQLLPKKITSCIF